MSKYCDDPDHCGYSDCPTVFCDRWKTNPTKLESHLLESVEYAKVLVDCRHVKTIPHMLENTAYVYLNRRERLSLVWRILKGILK